MSVVARKFASVPARLSSETWKAISEMICQQDAKAKADFTQVSGLASCLINDKMLAIAPLVMINDGPRLRVYCLYGDDAIDADDVNEDGLLWNPTAGEWKVFLPCPEDELDEYASNFKLKSSRFFVYDAEKGFEGEERTQKTVSNPNGTALTVDWEVFGKL